jgi:hypothetical protein
MVGHEYRPSFETRTTTTYRYCCSRPFPGPVRVTQPVALLMAFVLAAVHGTTPDTRAPRAARRSLPETSTQLQDLVDGGGRARGNIENRPRREVGDIGGCCRSR